MVLDIDKASFLWVEIFGLNSIFGNYALEMYYQTYNQKMIPLKNLKISISAKYVFKRLHAA